MFASRAAGAALAAGHTPRRPLPCLILRRRDHAVGQLILVRSWVRHVEAAAQLQQARSPPVRPAECRQVRDAAVLAWQAAERLIGPDG